MFRAFCNSVALLGGAGLIAACTAVGGGNVFGTTTIDGTGGAVTTGAGGTITGSGTGLGGEVIITTSTGSDTNTSGGVSCNYPNNVDHDGDGWTPDEGDCNDCDKNVNPGAIDTLHDTDGGAPVWFDEDCDGTKGSAYTNTCDGNMGVDSQNPDDGARAVELCQNAAANPATKKDKKWGVLDTRWVLPDGSDPATMVYSMDNYHLGHGMLAAFGPNVHVQAGTRMLGLSSGSARQPTDAGYHDVGGFDKGYTSGSPAGFPKESPACMGVTTGTPHDGAALEVEIRTPTNATGFTFDFNFFTYEWPNYVCSQFNDFFVALLTPIPSGQTDGNISFDNLGNPVSVNNAFVEVCGCSFMGPPCIAGGKTFSCSLGASTLMGTGFGGDTGMGQDHASTSWLLTKAPVTGGQVITLRWTVYDSGDGILDTTTLIDNWKWIANGGTVTVGTAPIETPK